MAPPSPPTAEQSIVRMLTLVLVIGFILEVGAAVTSLTLINLLAMDDSRIGFGRDFTLLPSIGRVFIWACIAVALFARWQSGGDLGGLVRAERDEPAWLPGVRGTCRGLALLVVPGEALFVCFNLVSRPSITVMGAKLDLGLSLVLALTFGLAVVLLEMEKSDATPLLELSPREEVAPAPHRLAPVPVPDASALTVPDASALTLPPVSEVLTGPCAVCTQPVQGPRCIACGAAVLAGGFRVTGLLAQSSHARTYLAHAPDGTKAVLKEMSFALVPDVAALAAFEREGLLLQQLRHPRLPRFLASFTEGSGAALRFYLAYVYVEGVSLAEELKQHHYTEAEAMELTRSVLRVLTYLHALSPPIIHRDIKPANLLRQPDGTIILVDFGSARDLTRTTQQATMVGTFGYMPREQLAGQVDATSDMYALGTTVLHLLTRQAPGELVDETGQFVFPRQLPVSAGFRRVLARLTAARRKERFPSAREALRVLDEPAPFQWPRWAPAAAGLLLLVAGGVLVLRRPRPVRAGPPPSVASPSAPESVPSAPPSPVLAHFSGGEVTEEELRERTARLPPKLRGLDSSQLRQSRLRTLVTEKLLVQEAARVVALKPEWGSLPAPLQLRQRLRALVETRMPAQTPTNQLSQERMKALSALGRELYEAAHVELDTARLGELVLSAAKPHWQPWEVQAARASLREAERPLAFQRDNEFSSPCTGRILPAAASYDARCECESLADIILEEDPFYFDLYLSGESPNLLFTSNSLTPSCRQIHLASGAPAYVAETMEAQTEFDVELHAEVLRAPDEARHEDIQHILEAMSPRFGECLNIRASKDHFEGNLHLLWDVEQGEVRGLEGAKDERTTDELSGSPVESCLSAVLESWRMVAIPPGTLSVNFHIKATRQPADLEMH